MPDPSSPEHTYDVVVIGGALGGASTALLLRRRFPGIRVAVVERTEAFRRRVGEATVELSGYFLSRVLGLGAYLNQNHLHKQGLRFWFDDGSAESVAECSEIGPRYLVRVQSFQLDRAVLDEHVLGLAREAGADVWRPANVVDVALEPGGTQTLTVDRDGRRETIAARWVVDASGVKAMLSRKLDLWEVNEQHTTTAVWARWRGVQDWDGVELADRHPEWAHAHQGLRGTATNHFMGDGWWAWCIPLKGGDTSVGVVFDNRRVEWPASGGRLADTLKTFLSQNAAAREILADAECLKGDVHLRKQLAYRSKAYAGDGWSLVGDAGAFLDPFYSPGLDWLSFTALTSVELVGAAYEGKAVASQVEKTNDRLTRSYRRWFEALYQNKYAYLGDFDLMRMAFLLDLGFYYLGVASQPYRRGPKALLEAVFATAPSTPFYKLICFYNRRLQKMADARRARGVFGARNTTRRFLFGGYTFGAGGVFKLLFAMRCWFWLELTEGWRSWGPRQERPAGVPEQTAKPEGV